MKNNFEYWVDNGGRQFLMFYWVQYAFFYLLAIGLTLKTKNLFTFLIVGLIPYIPILIFRSIRSPLGSLENGIRENDMSLYNRLMATVPEKYSGSPKFRGGYLCSALLKETDTNLTSKILVFKKNYYGINKHAIFSLGLWFITLFVLGTYLYINR